MAINQIKFNKRHNSIFFISIAVLFISIITVFLFIIKNSVYKALMILPITYSMLFIILLSGRLKNKKCKYSTVFATLVYGIRCVVYPFLVALANENYIGARYLPVSQDELSLSIILMAFEVLCASIAILVLDSKRIKVKQQTQTDYKLGGNKTVYLAFLILAIGLFFLFGRKYQLVNFIAFDSKEGYVPIETTLLKLVRQIIVVAASIAFCLVLGICKKKYEKTGKEKYINMSILAAMINISIIVGDRRAIQLIVTILSILILIELYPNKRRKIITLICTAGIFVILSMTLYRWGGTSGNRLSTINSRIGSFEGLATLVQLSYGGPDSIANGIRFGLNNDISILNLLYDFSRSTFGLSFIMDKLGTATSDLYNLYIYSGDYSTGQLLFSTSYGFITLGPLYPLITIFNIIMSFSFESWFRRSNTIEMKYMTGYCFTRVVMGSVQNPTSLLTIVTMQIGTMGLLIFVAMLFNKKKGKAI